MNIRNQKTKKKNVASMNQYFNTINWIFLIHKAIFFFIIIKIITSKNVLL